MPAQWGNNLSKLMIYLRLGFLKKSAKWDGEDLPKQPWSVELKKKIVMNMVRTGNIRISEANQDILRYQYSNLVKLYPLFLSEKNDLDNARMLYNLSYMTLWRQTQSIKNLKKFNKDIVVPYSNFIARNFEKNHPAISNRKTPKIAFLSATTTLGGGGAVGRVTISLILGFIQNRSEENHPIMYLLSKPEDLMVEFLNKNNIKFVLVSGSDFSDSASRVMRQCKADGVDVLIADSNMALQTYIFERRAAPIQVLHEMGFASWEIKELDLLSLGYTKESAGYIGKHAVSVRIPRNTAPVFQIAHRSMKEIDDFKKRIISATSKQKPSTIYGVYGRLVKLSRTFIDTIKEILKAAIDAIMFIGGVGPAELASELKDDPEVGDRIAFFHEFVDGHVVGECIDVFLDTFPFPGGVSCIEVQARGRPVVWLDGSSAHGFALVTEQRDPALGAGDTAEYCQKALMLEHEDTRRSYSEAAKLVAEEFGDVSTQAAVLDEYLLALWQQKRDGRDTY